MTSYVVREISVAIQTGLVHLQMMNMTTILVRK